MFNPKKFIEDAIREIKEEVKDKAIIAVSGGVDSTTTAVLAYKAIGNLLHCIFVDHGFLRKGEKERVINTFKNLKIPLKVIDAEEIFLSKLRGIVDPEEKRKIIGKTFIEIFENEAKRINAKYLLQGTIAPDWIETEGGIKSHHNVALPSGMVLEVVEPLRDLYKDEVRKVAKELGLPKEIYEAMPFPGPGLAIRVLGEVTKDKIEIVREANAIVEEEVKKAGLKPWQAFAVLLNDKATGVKGDQREYGYIIVVRIVESIDAMTANAMQVDWNVLKNIMKRITREIPNVTRVLYDITDKPPATIEFE